ncbi:50S ribosomal protein L18 [Candidatus Woesearchaeota archaeon]|nr:50S ribosomal protein L18 [Candidatus Woesearchaeota archaeon]
MNRTKSRIQFHRKKSGKTNYKKRLELLKSRKDRLVIRKTNKYLIIQMVKYEAKGDRVVVSTNSKELVKLGWKNSCKNIPACYLTGLLLGKKAKEKGLKEAILDIGLQTPIKGSKLFAALKGLIDLGLNVPSSEQIFPVNERIQGKHISDKIVKDFELTKNKIMK